MFISIFSNRIIHCESFSVFLFPFVRSHWWVGEPVRKKSSDRYHFPLPSYIHARLKYPDVQKISANFGQNDKNIFFWLFQSCSSISFYTSWHDMTWPGWWPCTRLVRSSWLSYTPDTLHAFKERKYNRISRDIDISIESKS